MKKAIITTTAALAGSMIIAPAAMAAPSWSASEVNGECVVTVSGFQPGEGLTDSGTRPEPQFYADGQGNYTTTVSSEQGTANPDTQIKSGLNIYGENRDKAYFAYSDAWSQCQAGNQATANSQNTTQQNTIATTPAQDNTATSTTAGVAKSNDSALVLAGAASVAALGTGVFIARRKKA